MKTRKIAPSVVGRLGERRGGSMKKAGKRTNGAIRRHADPNSYIRRRHPPSESLRYDPSTRLSSPAKSR
jgi:hypothetical protein